MVEIPLQRFPKRAGRSPAVGKFYHNCRTNAHAVIFHHGSEERQFTSHCAMGCRHIGNHRVYRLAHISSPFQSAPAANSSTAPVWHANRALVGIAGRFERLLRHGLERYPCVDIYDTCRSGCDPGETLPTSRWIASAFHRSKPTLF